MNLFGDKTSFAIGIHALGGPPPEPDPGAAATWTRVQLWVDGTNLFKHTRLDTEKFVDGISWPAIYLARWLVRSWEELFYEAAWPIPTTRRNARDVIDLLNLRLGELIEADAPEEEEDVLIDQRDQFIATHSLLMAAAGGALPSVYISRHDDSISISWRESRRGNTEFHLSRGEADVPAKLFLSVIQEFVSWVLEQLLDHAPLQSDVTLFQEWLDSLSAEESAKTALLHQTGLRKRWPHLSQKDSGEKYEFTDFFELPSDWSQQGVLVQPAISPVTMAFRCVSPVLNDQELVSLRHFITKIESHPDAMSRLDELSAELGRPLSTEKDFEQGYSLAIKLRQVLNNAETHFDIENFLLEMGIPIEEYPLNDSDIDGAAVCDAHHGPLVLVNPNSKKAHNSWSRRMILAHELCHLLVDRHAAMSLAVISGPWAPPRLERRANAFAIELLLPKAGIKAVLGNFFEAPEDEDVQKLMSIFEIGMTATTGHIQNRFNW